MTPRLPPLSAAQSAVRSAVRAAAGGAAPGRRPRLLAGVSGGADSLALAWALASLQAAGDIEAVALVVDHGLQPGSAEVADDAVRTLRALGLDATSVAVDVPAGAGPEAAARSARRAALAARASELGADRIVLGHTLDDQAETVLLQLARGSGAASISGMAVDDGLVLRPMLGLARAVVRAAAEDAGLSAWEDPQNADARFARARGRASTLPTLERDLGPGVAAALARTADLAREDDEALASLAAAALAVASGPPADDAGRRSRPRAGAGGDERSHLREGASGEERSRPQLDAAGAERSVPAAALAAEPAAVRQRMVRILAGELGSSPSRAQTLEVCRLAVAWSGQGAVGLPGATAERVGGDVVLRAAGGARRPPADA